MVLAVVLLFVFLAYGSSAKFHDTNIQSGDLQKNNVDYFLCRHCGADFAPLTSVTSIESPSSIKSRVTQIFGLKDVKVQTLQNPIRLKVEIITLSKALCIGKGNVSNNI